MKYIITIFIIATGIVVFILVLNGCQVVKINTSECLASEAMVLNKVHCEVPQ